MVANFGPIIFHKLIIFGSSEEWKVKNMDVQLPFSIGLQYVPVSICSLG